MPKADAEIKPRTVGDGRDTRASIQVPRTTFWGTATKSRHSKGSCYGAKIMLFDEPTSALDPEMIKKFLML